MVKSVTFVGDAVLMTNHTKSCLHNH